MSGRIPFRATPMLATSAAAPFHAPGWVYEEKYDGVRILAYKEADRVTLLSRNGRDRTASFAAVARAVGALAPRSVLLDGEVVAFDAGLVSRFQLLQHGSAPLIYAVFDCLWLDGHDLRGEPLRTRRRLLEAVVDGSERLFPSRRLARHGLTAHREALHRGYEGLVAKDASSPYVEERSPSWRKIKTLTSDDFVIGGCTSPAGTRLHFGALLLGAHAGARLHFVGKVGTGFSDATLAALHRTFAPLAQDRPAFVDPPRQRGIVWLAPTLVARVSFQEWTADGKLRAPLFLGLRDDARPEDCVLRARDVRG